MGFDHDKWAIDAGAELGKGLQDNFYTAANTKRLQAHQQHSGRAYSSVLGNQTEISVVREQDTVLALGDLEHSNVIEARRHVQDGGYVMTSDPQAVDHLAFAIFVSEYFHSAARGKVRSPESKADA